jgi:NAD(P)-dependent dehydrogenase (short-subunit alcohol dehydrogenase family)
VADDPRLPAARDRAPRLHPPGRVDGRDPPAVGLGAYGAAKSGVENLGHALRVETQHYGVDVGVAYFSWIDTEMVRGGDRTELGASMRAMLTGPARQDLPGERGRPRRSCAGSSTAAASSPARAGCSASCGSSDPPRLTERKLRN